MNPRLYKSAVSVSPEKIKPEGLLCAAKILDRFIGADDLVFAGLVLIFKDQAMLESFRSKIISREQNDKLVVPVLSYASCSHISGMQNRDRFLSVNFPVNSESYFAAQKDSNKTGELLLQELEKHVDLMGVAAIVYNTDSGRIIDQADGIEKELEMPSSRFKMN